MEQLVVSKKRLRDESESEIDSPEVKRLKENLLDSFDDDSEFCTINQDLDSFMKSFEEEITASPSSDAAASGGGAAAEVVDLTSETGESQPELGYLLEASDDELGLPPTTTSSPVGLRTELDQVEFDPLGGEFWENPSYDPFVFGFGETDNYDADGNGDVAFDGLFDYSDMGFGSSEFLWRPETTPAQ